MSADKLYLHLFQGFGIELEYMIVHEKDLSVYPIADRVLQDEQGGYLSEMTFDATAWSNELVAHVIELKTNGPCQNFIDQPQYFLNDIKKINKKLKAFKAKLLPTGAHPFMDPDTETKLWPHEQNEVYDAFNKIFDCRGHGWSNLQSTHLNLPFANDEEFAKLHTAIRLVLPILPALSASTPMLDGKFTGFIDSRLECYRHNQRKIPSISSLVIPEAVLSEKDYQEKILNKIYHDIAPYDPEGILQYEWLNSRGAIARFDRNTIEIRIIDIQESPWADIAILAAVTSVLKSLIEQKWGTFAHQFALHENELAEIFVNVVKQGSNAFIDNQKYLKMFGYQGESVTAKKLWQHILSQTFFAETQYQNLFKPIELILAQGNLSERIIAALKGDDSKQNVCKIYNRLADCLNEGSLFNA